IVIGAGFGGVSAGYELKSAGYEVTMIEARDRIGGRVHTLDRFIKDKTVEAGGEMVGANHPVWAAYAKAMGIKFREIVYALDADAPIVLGGERLNPGAARRVWEGRKQGPWGVKGEARTVEAYNAPKSSGP